MKYSVIIPVFHSQRFIGRCLDALISQTVTDDFEILCVGDRIEDPCHEIIEEYAKKHPGKVQLHIQDGIGKGGARNLGLSIAKGEYIMFADSDDYVESTILADCEKSLNDCNADFVCVAFDRIDIEGKRFSYDQSVPDITIVDVTPENASKLAFLYTAPWGKLFKRDLLEGWTFPEHRISTHEDCIYMLSVHTRVKRYVMQPKVLYHYLVHDEQDTQTSSSMEKARIFRSEMAGLKTRFEAEGIAVPYLKMLDIAAFIHIGIADAHRIADNPEVSLREFCAGAKSFLNENFPGWRKIKLRPYGSFTMRCAAVWVSKLMFRLNVFWIFIKAYNLMIKIFHKDVKW